MERLQGVGASPGIAIGVAHVVGSRVEVHERRISAQAVDAELQRFERALADTDAQLARIQEQIAAREKDQQQYSLLEAHRLMLQDVHLVDVARRVIREEKTGAEWAVRKALDQIQAVFDRIEDPYFRDRRSDVAVVGERLLRTLMGMVETITADVVPGSLAVAGRLTRPSCRAPWGCRTWSGSRDSGTGSGRG
jgi:phosphoenolpyruvate-protein phosphotransferase (PTS system enzyme I)